MHSERGSIRAVMVDNHPLVCEGTRACLERFGGIEVVATTGKGREALHLLEKHRADVLILDVKLPDLNGVEVARQVRHSFPQVRILVLTAHDEAMYFQAMVRLGVHGYLTESTSCEKLAAAIQCLAMGGTFLETMSSRDIWPGIDQWITSRELVVLANLAQGKRNSEIAADLAISVKTVESHLGNILSKLHARSRTEAILKAREMGLVPLDPRDAAVWLCHTPAPSRVHGSR